MLLLLLACVAAVGSLWDGDVGLLIGDLVGYFPSLYASLPSMWDPMVQGGTPLLPNPQAGFFYPPAWLLRGDLQGGLPIFLFAHFAVGAIATWAWVRTRFGDGVEALLAGLVFALSGPTFSLAITPDKLPGHVLLPVLFLGLHWWMGDDRRARRRQGFLLSTLAVTGMWFGGSVEAVLMAGMAAPLWAAFLPGAENTARLQRGAGAVGVLALGTAVAGCLLVPFFVLLPETARAGALPMAEALERATHPIDWLGWLAPNPFWQGEELRYVTSDGVGRSRWLRSLYGSAACIALLPALLAARRSAPGKGQHAGAGGTRQFVFTDFRILAVPGGKLIPMRKQRIEPIVGVTLSVVGFFAFAMLALGDLNPLRSILHAVPGLGSIRYPDKWWLGTVPMQAWLAASALRAIRTDIRAARLAAIGTGVLLALALGGLTLDYGGGPLQRAVVRLSDATLYLAVSLAVLVRWSRGGVGFAGILVLAVFADLTTASIRSVPFAEDRADRPSVIAAIRADQARTPPTTDGPVRLWDLSLHLNNRLPAPREGQSVPDMQRAILAPNIATEYGVGYVDGMRALRMERQSIYSAVLEDLELPYSRELLRVMGADYWLVWGFDDAMDLARDAGLRPVPAAPGMPL
ncbi:MAG: hypothetical protein KDA24_09345, partial [Deltaproteobacteria bacterium]|nr:hypothetical protein [Deltaproteobacteria bacterium]